MTKIPKALRKQLQEYEEHGFHVARIDEARGSHYKVRFKEFSEPQVLTVNITDRRSIHNNLSRFRRLSRNQ